MDSNTKSNVKLPTKEELKKKALFIPCKTKDDLHRWIKIYLGFDMPNSRVDPDSTSCPMDIIWEIYDAALNNKPLPQIMAMASRDSQKTWSAAVLEVLMIVHLGRSVAHMAAIEPQAKRCQAYVKKFLNRPLLREYLTSKNDSSIEFTRYYNKNTGENLSFKEYKARGRPVEYEEIIHTIEIVICSIAGSNSAHVPFLCVDGKTRILVANDKHKRKRKSRTIKGLFTEIAKLTNTKTCTNKKVRFKNQIVIDNLEKYNIKVLSLNTDNGKFEFRPIVRMIRQYSDSIKIKIKNNKDFICTPSHRLYVVGKGFIEAKDIAVGDKVIKINKVQTEANPVGPIKSNYIVKYKNINTDNFEQTILGSLLGDGCIYKKHNNNPCFIENHGLAQANYLEWKRQTIGNKLRTVSTSSISGYTGQKIVGIRTGCTPLLSPYTNFRTNLSSGLLNKLEALGLAIWYMDDGCAGHSFRLSTEGFGKAGNKKLAAFLKTKFDLHPKVLSYTRKDKTYWYLSGTAEDKRKLYDICKPYIHPDLAYKFTLENNKQQCSVCGQDYFFYEMGLGAKVCGNTICRNVIKKRVSMGEVLSIEPAGKRFVYDFTLDKNHNFIGNGVLSHQCLDELDVIEGEKRVAYEESKMIPAAFDGKLPITFYISSRKHSFGLVQKEINDSHKTGLQVRQWNIMDVTEPCPPTRHRPELPKIPIYTNDDELRAISKDEYDLLDDNDKNKFTQHEGYSGCLQNCKMFSVCKGRLATEQKSKSTFLKPIDHTQAVFAKVSVDTAKAQLMCWEPSKEALVFPKFSRSRHVVKPHIMAEYITGEPHPPTFKKSDLISLMKNIGMSFVAGMDFGYTHNFAVALGAMDGGNRLFIFDTIVRPELELSQCIEVCQDRYKSFEPTIFADVAYPAYIKTFKKSGFKMKDWVKERGSVLGGIEIMRLKFSPINGRPPEMFILDDPECEYLINGLLMYRWNLDASERPTETPNDDDDDILDALRYLCLNVFSQKNKLAAPEVDLSQSSTGQANQYTKEDWMRKVIAEKTGDESLPADGTGIHRSKNGGFKWSF